MFLLLGSLRIAVLTYSTYSAAASVKLVPALRAS